MPTKKKSTKVSVATVMKFVEQSAPVTASVFDKGLCFQFTFGMPGFRARVDKDQIDAGDADKDMLSVGKKLLECDEYDAIRSLYGDIKKYLGRKAIPTTLRKSYYLIPIEIAEEAMQKMLEYETELGVRVDTFIAVYSATKENAKKRLGKLYHEDDYPAASALKGSFYMEFSPSEERVPGRLEAINKKLFVKYSEDLKKKMIEAAGDIRILLRTQLHEMTLHLKERLSGTNNKGEKKVFRQTAIQHIMEFIENFEPKNVTDDKDLTKVVGTLRKLMEGVDAETLRDDEKFRARVASDFTAVVADLDVLVTAQAARAVKLPTKKEQAA